MDARVMMARMGEAANPRPEMLAAIKTLKQAGLRVGALTNNWAHSRDETGHNDGTRALKDRFHVFIESSVEGLRKPDPAIYRLARERLGVPVEAIAFLDDIGPNLKPPRAMGMTTIKVVTAGQALEELERAVGFSLR
jgi:putative hydrolase of the HAD superfamily